MILAFDVGNTNIVMGVLDEEKTYFLTRFATDHGKTEAEYAVLVKNILLLPTMISCFDGKLYLLNKPHQIRKI